MSAEQIKRLAYDFADALSKFDAKAGTQDAVIAKQAALHAAIDAHTAVPPINAAPARQFDLRPDREIVAEQARKREPEQWAERAAPNEPVTVDHLPGTTGDSIEDAIAYVKANEPVAPLPSAELREYAQHLRNGDWNLRAPQEMADMIAAALDQIAERASPQAVPVAWMAKYVDLDGRASSRLTTHYGLACEEDADRNPVPLYTAPQAVDAPVAWYVERHAPGKRDHGMKLGPFWKKEAAEEWVDDRHHLKPLYALKAPAKESDV